MARHVTVLMGLVWQSGLQFFLNLGAVCVFSLLDRNSPFTNAASCLPPSLRRVRRRLQPTHRARG